MRIKQRGYRRRRWWVVTGGVVGLLVAIGMSLAWYLTTESAGERLLQWARPVLGKAGVKVGYEQGAFAPLRRLHFRGLDVQIEAGPLRGGLKTPELLLEYRLRLFPLRLQVARAYMERPQIEWTSTQAPATQHPPLPWLSLLREWAAAPPVRLTIDDLVVRDLRLEANVATAMGHLRLALPALTASLRGRWVPGELAAQLSTEIAPATMPTPKSARPAVVVSGRDGAEILAFSPRWRLSGELGLRRGADETWRHEVTVENFALELSQLHWPTETLQAPDVRIAGQVEMALQASAPLTISDSTRITKLRGEVTGSMPMLSLGGAKGDRQPTIEMKNQSLALKLFATDQGSEGPNYHLLAQHSVEQMRAVKWLTKAVPHFSQLALASQSDLKTLTGSFSAQLGEKAWLEGKVIDVRPLTTTLRLFPRPWQSLLRSLRNYGRPLPSELALEFTGAELGPSEEKPPGAPLFAPPRMPWTAQVQVDGAPFVDLQIAASSDGSIADSGAILPPLRLTIVTVLEDRQWRALGFPQLTAWGGWRWQGTLDYDPRPEGHAVQLAGELRPTPGAAEPPSGNARVGPLAVSGQGRLQKNGRWVLENFQGDGLEGRLVARLSGVGDTLTGNFRLDGELGLRRSPQTSSLMGHRLAGELQVPWTLMVRAGTDVELKGEIRFRDFAWSYGEYGVKGVNGKIPIIERLRVTKGQLHYDYLLQRNPFERVSFESVQPYLAQDNQVIVDSLHFAEKNYGPLMGYFSVRQNIWAIHQFDLRLGAGRMAGEFFLGARPRNLEMGLLARVVGLRPAELIPRKWQRANGSHDKSVSGRMGLVFDLNRNTLNGRVDVIEVGAEQLVTLVDVLDPRYKDQTLNQVRSALSIAYPTSAGFLFKQGFLDMKVKMGGGLTATFDVFAVPVSGLMAPMTNAIAEKLREVPIQ